MAGATQESVERRMLTDPNVVSLSFVSVVGMVGVLAVPPALPSIVSAFGVSEARIGLIMTVYTLPGILSVPITGVLADVYGRRVVLLPTFFLTCALGIAVAGVDTYPAVLALRFAQGVVVGGVMPLIPTVLGDLYTGSVGSTAQGIRLSANGLSIVLIPPLAGFLSEFAWQYPFLLYAAGFPVVAYAYLVLPETGSRSSGQSFRSDLRAYLGSMRGEVRDPDVLVLLAGGFVRGAGLYALLTYLPLFAARDIGATAFAIGLVLAARGVVRILVSPFTGRMLSVLSRRWSLVGGLLLGVGGVALVPVATSTVGLAVAFGLFGLGDAVFTPIHRDSVAVVTGEDGRAGVMSGLTVTRKVGTTLSPVVFGVVLATMGFPAVFGLTVVLFLAYALAVALYFHPERAPARAGPG